MPEDLITLLSELKEQDALRVAEERLNAGADAYRPDAMAALAQAKEWIGGG
jgi:hypothetical protein